MRIINSWEMLLTKYFYSNWVVHSLGKFQNSPSFSKSSKLAIYLKDQLPLSRGTAFHIQYPQAFRGQLVHTMVGPVHRVYSRQTQQGLQGGRVLPGTPACSKSPYCVLMCLITHIMAAEHCNLEGYALYLHAWSQTGIKHKALNTPCLTQKQTPDKNFWNPL